jgi:hypothetical protein
MRISTVTSWVKAALAIFVLAATTQAQQAETPTEASTAIAALKAAEHAARWAAEATESENAALRNAAQLTAAARARGEVAKWMAEGGWEHAVRWSWLWAAESRGWWKSAARRPVGMTPGVDRHRPATKDEADILAERAAKAAETVEAVKKLGKGRDRYTRWAELRAEFAAERAKDAQERAAVSARRAATQGARAALDKLGPQATKAAEDADDALLYVATEILISKQAPQPERVRSHLRGSEAFMRRTPEGKKPRTRAQLIVWAAAVAAAEAQKKIAEVTGNATALDRWTATIAWAQAERKSVAAAAAAKEAEYESKANGERVAEDLKELSTAKAALSEAEKKLADAQKRVKEAKQAFDKQKKERAPSGRPDWAVTNKLRTAQREEQRERAATEHARGKATAREEQWAAANNAAADSGAKLPKSIAEAKAATESAANLRAEAQAKWEKAAKAAAAEHVIETKKAAKHREEAAVMAKAAAKWEAEAKAIARAKAAE